LKRKNFIFKFCIFFSREEEEEEQKSDKPVEEVSENSFYPFSIHRFFLARRINT
jgi:hypothetical protein